MQIIQHAIKEAHVNVRATARVARGEAALIGIRVRNVIYTIKNKIIFMNGSYSRNAQTIHKGMAFTIETTIVIILAVLVLAVLVFFFMNYFGGSENEVTLQVKQKDNCLAYARTNSKCSYTLNNRVSSSVRTTLEDVCKKLSFPECSNPPLGIPCVRQCCKEYCSGGANRCVQDLGGSSCGRSCSAGEIPEGNADCQQPPLDSTYKCCK